MRSLILFIITQVSKCMKNDQRTCKIHYRVFFCCCCIFKMLQLILFYVYILLFGAFLWNIVLFSSTWVLHPTRQTLGDENDDVWLCYWCGKNQIVWHTFYHTFRCVKIIAAKVKGAEILVAVAKKRKYCKKTVIFLAWFNTSYTHILIRFCFNDFGFTRKKMHFHWRKNTRLIIYENIFCQIRFSDRWHVHLDRYSSMFFSLF